MTSDLRSRGVVETIDDLRKEIHKSGTGDRQTGIATLSRVIRRQMLQAPRALTIADTMGRSEDLDDPCRAVLSNGIVKGRVRTNERQRITAERSFAAGKPAL